MISAPYEDALGFKNQVLNLVLFLSVYIDFN